jgi:hypothetical protein
VPFQAEQRQLFLDADPPDSLSRVVWQSLAFKEFPLLPAALFQPFQFFFLLPAKLSASVEDVGRQTVARANLHDQSVRQGARFSGLIATEAADTDHPSTDIRRYGIVLVGIGFHRRYSRGRP